MEKNDLDTGIKGICFHLLSGALSLWYSAFVVIGLGNVTFVEKNKHIQIVTFTDSTYPDRKTLVPRAFPLGHTQCMMGERKESEKKRVGDVLASKLQLTRDVKDGIIGFKDKQDSRDAKNA